MMIKYRVHEVAKDLEIPNKDVIDVLKDYTGETKKHMTALTEDELDLVFESFTQKNNMDSLDGYFAEGTKQEEPLVTVEQEAAPAAQAQPEQAKQPAPKAPKAAKAPQAEPARAPGKTQEQKPVQPAQQDGQPQRKAVKPGKITPVRPRPEAQQGQQAQQNQQRRPAPAAQGTAQSSAAPRGGEGYARRSATPARALRRFAPPLYAALGALLATGAWGCALWMQWL